MGIDYSKVMKPMDYGVSSLENNRKAQLKFRETREPQFYDRHPVPEQVKEQVIAIEFLLIKNEQNLGLGIITIPGSTIHQIMYSMEFM
ncbi:hypothetical protein ACFY5J_26955 [Peribacillus butanolivorans]|uniref:hypothetical protein n=1 Tax=Peribacillus butanolivorans TaxID=421767 RepID=UPI003683CBD0